MSDSPTCGDAGGVTKAGTPCKRPVPGGGRCALHPESGETPDNVGRPAFEFTEKQIGKVEDLAAVMKQAEIADFFGISDRTLRRTFLRDERVMAAYRRGRARAVARLGTDVLRDARGLTPGISDREQRKAREFYLRTQAGWSEKAALELSGPEGGPIETRDVSPRDRLAERLERMEAAMREGDDTDDE